MTSRENALDLANLDDAPLLALNPNTLSSNLAALRRAAPQVAIAIEAASIPAHWRSVSALDGSATYRIERPGEPAAWLAASAAPQARAQALVGAASFGEQNVALPAAGAGAELRLLLNRLAPHQAVFCFAAAAETRAVLSLSDFSASIERRRLLILPDQPFEAALTALLDENPGLLPPATIVNLPDIGVDRIESVRQQCDRVARRVLALRTERLNAIAAALNEAKPSGGLRLACVALNADERGHALARELSAAGERVGLAVSDFSLDSPLRAHPIALAEILGVLRPTHILRCDADSRALPIVPGAATVLRLCTSPIALPAPGGAERPLAAGPHMRRALHDAGFRDAEILELFWACPPPGPLPKAARRAIAIIGDLPDASAAGCGIEQPTQRTLWERLERLLTERWGTEDAVRPGLLLRAAERELGFELKEPDLRARLLRLIEYVLTPAVVLHKLRAIATARFGDEVVLVGRGWKPTGTGAAFPSVACAVSAGVHPIGAVGTVLPLGLSGDLVSAAAAEWPILLHVPPRDKLARWVGDVLERDKHLCEFSTERELHRALEQIASGDGRIAALTASARLHVVSLHSWDARLRTLARQLSRD